MVILVVAILRTIPCERRKIKALNPGLLTHCMMSGSPPWTTLELWDFNFRSEPGAKGALCERGWEGRRKSARGRVTLGFLSIKQPPKQPTCRSREACLARLASLGRGYNGAHEAPLRNVH